jgi:hypothetical protein
MNDNLLRKLIEDRINGRYYKLAMENAGKDGVSLCLPCWGIRSPDALKRAVEIIEELLPEWEFKKGRLFRKPLAANEPRTTNEYTN